MLKKLRILKIQDILILQTLKMHHKHQNDQLPTYTKLHAIKKYTITIHANQMSYTHIELFTCLQKSVSDIT